MKKKGIIKMNEKVEIESQCIFGVVKIKGSENPDVYKICVNDKEDWLNNKSISDWYVQEVAMALTETDIILEQVTKNCYVVCDEKMSKTKIIEFMIDLGAEHNEEFEAFVEE